jgi:hypothetical protein
MGKVVYTNTSGLKFEGDKFFEQFINSLNDSEDYASDREFIRDLPERLASYIHAQIEVDD